MPRPTKPFKIGAAIRRPSSRQVYVVTSMSWTERGWFVHGRYGVLQVFDYADRFEPAESVQ